MSNSWLTTVSPLALIDFSLHYVSALWAPCNCSQAWYIAGSLNQIINNIQNGPFLVPVQELVWIYCIYNFTIGKGTLKPFSSLYREVQRVLEA